MEGPSECETSDVTRGRRIRAPVSIHSGPAHPESFGSWWFVLIRDLAKRGSDRIIWSVGHEHTVQLQYANRGAMRTLQSWIVWGPSRRQAVPIRLSSQLCTANEGVLTDNAGGHRSHDSSAASKSRRIGPELVREAAAAQPRPFRPTLETDGDSPTNRCVHDKVIITSHKPAF